MSLEVLLIEDNEGDVEIIFVVPPREYIKIYDKYELDPSIPIETAIALISDLGRGGELSSDLSENIECINKFVWMSFDEWKSAASSIIRTSRTFILFNYGNAVSTPLFQ